MKCTEAQQQMRAYVDGQLSDKEAEAFLDHVEDCRDCREELELYLAVHYTLDDTMTGSDWHLSGVSEQMEQVRTGIRRRRMRRSLLALTAAAVILLTGGLLYALFGVQSKKSGGDRPEAETEQTEALSEAAAEAIPGSEAQAEAVPVSEAQAEAVPVSETQAEAVPVSETQAETGAPAETAAQGGQAET